MELFQLDVSNALLLSGFEYEKSNMVYKLKKISIWHQWFEKLSQILIAYGFKQSLSDYSLFAYCRNNTYGNDILFINLVKNKLNQEFQLNEIGRLKSF